MCNLYSVSKGQVAIIALTRALRDTTGNLPSMPGIFFPDYPAPVVCNAPDGMCDACLARWGMPSSQFALMEAAKKRAARPQAKNIEVDFKHLPRMEPDSGTTNIRNVSSQHWTRWLDVEYRCVVPFASFSEFTKEASGDIWFALLRPGPLPCSLASPATGPACARSEKEKPERSIRLPDNRAKRRDWSDPGNARDTEDDRRKRNLVDGACARGTADATAIADGLLRIVQRGGKKDELTELGAA